MSKNQTFSGFIKTTILSGIFFLVPILILFYGISKLKIYMEEIAIAIHPERHIETWTEIFLVNLFAVLFFLCIAFAVGLVVRLSIFKRTRHSLGDFVAKVFPAYEFIKAYAEDLAAVDKSSSSFIPVLVDLGSSSRLGFQVDQFEDGTVAIYLPGTPNPWSGSVCYVETSKCQSLPISLHNSLEYCRMPGNHHTALAEVLRDIKRK